jgi:hypothetical protein
VLQNGHVQQLLRDQPCDSLGASQRKPIFEGCNKPQFVQPKLKLFVKMITASPIARCPSFKILHDADVAFGISGAELRTVLSATTMLADSRTA